MIALDEIDADEVADDDQHAVSEPATPSKVNKRPERIHRDPGVNCGRATVRGTDVPVWLLLVVKRAAFGDAEILRLFPSITDRDLTAALFFAEDHPDEMKSAIAACRADLAAGY